MSIPEQQEQSIEERIGSAIGKAFVLALPLQALALLLNGEGDYSPIH
jgi:hypothetical protein